jgi:hypothetical protein
MKIYSHNQTLWLKGLNTKIWPTLQYMFKFRYFPISLPKNTFISKHYSHETKILYAAALDFFLLELELCMLQGRVNSFTHGNTLLATFHCLTTLQNIWISLCNHQRHFLCIYKWWPQFHLKSWKEKNRDINLLQLTVIHYEPESWVQWKAQKLPHIYL